MVERKSNLENIFAFIHVPKSAGTSLRSIFQEWFGKGVITHYFHEPSGGKPSPICTTTALNNVNEYGVCCIYGHFNRKRGFGVEHNIPFVKNFFTFLREPFSQFVSEYKYKVVRSRSNLCFEDYLFKTSPNYLNHFPTIITYKNYKTEIDNFEFVGIFEYFNESVGFMAELFNKEVPENISERKNVGPSIDIDFIPYKSAFEELNRLECEVYRYARKKFEGKVL